MCWEIIYMLTIFFMISVYGINQLRHCLNVLKISLEILYIYILYIPMKITWAMYNTNIQTWYISFCCECCTSTSYILLVRWRHSKWPTRRATWHFESCIKAYSFKKLCIWQFGVVVQMSDKYGLSVWSVYLKKSQYCLVLLITCATTEFWFPKKIS